MSSGKGMMGKGMMASPAQMKMRAAMMKLREANKGMHEKMMAKKKEMATIIKAKKFNKADFLAKHKEIKTMREKMSHLRVKARADVLAGMSAQERSTLKMHGRKGGRHGMMNKGKMKKGKGMGNGMGRMN